MKEYVKPQMEIVEMEMQQSILSILTTSGEVSDTGAGIGRKRNDLWDDEIE